MTPVERVLRGTKQLVGDPKREPHPESVVALCR